MSSHSTSLTPPLVQQHVISIVQGVYQLSEPGFPLADCAFFNRDNVTINYAEAEQYLSRHGQFRLVDRPLGSKVFSMATKAFCAETRRAKFTIALNELVPHGFWRDYILAHEFSHVLLHSKLHEEGILSALLQGVMDVPERSMTHYFADIESDVFALILLMGDWMLERLEERRQPIAGPMLCEYYERITGQRLPIAAAADRIRIYSIRSNSAPVALDWEMVGRQGWLRLEMQQPGLEELL